MQAEGITISQVIGAVGVIQTLVLGIMAYLLKNVENAILKETAAIKEWTAQHFVDKEYFRQTACTRYECSERKQN